MFDLCEILDPPEARVVTRRLVLAAGIAQAHHQSHAHLVSMKRPARLGRAGLGPAIRGCDYFLSSFFFSGSAFSAPAAGAAAVATAPSVAAASASGSTSARGMTIVTTTASSPERN